MIDVKFPADLRDVWQRLAQKHVGTWAHVADLILAERSVGKESRYFSGWRPNAD